MGKRSRQKALSRVLRSFCKDLAAEQERIRACRPELPSVANHPDLVFVPEAEPRETAAGVLERDFIETFDRQSIADMKYVQSEATLAYLPSEDIAPVTFVPLAPQDPSFLAFNKSYEDVLDEIICGLGIPPHLAGSPT